MRLTKKLVKDELDLLRNKIKSYAEMTTVELQEAFRYTFPEEVKERGEAWLADDCTREFLAYRLTMAATWWVSLVLDLD